MFINYHNFVVNVCFGYGNSTSIHLQLAARLSPTVRLTAVNRYFAEEHTELAADLIEFEYAPLYNKFFFFAQC